jgi:F0F1-type ATP synthase epsilon subunit
MSESLFKLEIVSQTLTQSLMVEWVEINSPTGNFVVAAEHDDIFSLLKKREKFTYKTPNEEPKSLDILYGGIFRFANNTGVVLID